MTSPTPEEYQNYEGDEFDNLAGRILSEFSISGIPARTWGNLQDRIAEVLRDARKEEREACALQVRKDCIACDGSGHDDRGFECEYCGRPMDAIRARGKDDE